MLVVNTINKNTIAPIIIRDSAPTLSLKYEKGYHRTDSFIGNQTYRIFVINLEHLSLRSNCIKFTQ